MGDEERSILPLIPMDAAAMRSIPRCFSRYATISGDTEYAQITFGNPVVAQDGNTPGPSLFPEVVCYMTLGHLARLRDAIDSHISKMEELISEELAKVDSDEVRQ